MKRVKELASVNNVANVSTEKRWSPVWKLFVIFNSDLDMQLKPIPLHNTSSSVTSSCWHQSGLFCENGHTCASSITARLLLQVGALKRTTRVTGRGREEVQNSEMRGALVTWEEKSSRLWFFIQYEVCWDCDTCCLRQTPTVYCRSEVKIRAMWGPQDRFYF